MMHKILLIISCLVLGSFHLSYAQKKKVRPKKYWVTFTDKDDSPYSIHKPWEFLSQRAIDRRQRLGIAMEPEDLPVNPQYVDGLEERGAKQVFTSRWFNAALVVGVDSMVDYWKEIPYVDSVEYVGLHLRKRFFFKKEGKERDVKKNYHRISDFYGYGADQIKMTNGHWLHEQGFDGDGVFITLLDGGYINVDIMPFFDSLRKEDRLFAGYDFVEDDDYVFETSQHGSQVLSVMAANLPGKLVGSAPDATYFCVKTEDAKREHLVEECNWIAGVEYADSIGADVINSSLGYTVFKEKQMNYKYEELDGLHSRATKAADIAFEKGMLVVNSAGNEGQSSWKYISIPADGFNTIAVGAVDPLGQKASFSSFGPTADNRVKPNISVMGEQIIVASPYSYFIEPSNGTSFASPLAAGSIACLRQAFPDKSPFEIKEAIERSASQAERPDDRLGFGIPDFKKAFELLNDAYLIPKNDQDNSIEFRVPASAREILVPGNPQTLWLRLFSSTGQLLEELELKGLLDKDKPFTIDIHRFDKAFFGQLIFAP